jgi:hypothetical protein
MALNQDLDPNRLEDTVRRAFLRTPEKVLLKAGERLYRWSGRPLQDGGRISPWWSFVESRRLPSGVVADGFRVSEERARRIGSSHRQFAQRRAAISEEFGNAMTNLIVAQLINDAWALAGQASGQPEFAKERRELQHVFLIGGACQVWIPNLSARDVQQLPALA